MNTADQTPTAAPGQAPNSNELPYPEWPEVLDSLLDVLARLYANGRPAPRLSGQPEPADGHPPNPAVQSAHDLPLPAGLTPPDCSGAAQLAQNFREFVEAVMVLHIQARLRHNRQARLDGLTPGEKGGHD